MITVKTHASLHLGAHQEIVMLTTLLVLIAVGSVLLWTFSQEKGKSTAEKTLFDDSDDA
jgi:hypothetical protein